MYSHGLQIKYHMTQACPLNFRDCFFCHCHLINFPKKGNENRTNQKQKKHALTREKSIWKYPQFTSLLLKCHYDRKIILNPFFLQILKACSLNTKLAKFWVWVSSKGCLFWVEVLDFTVCHYSRSKLTNWTSEGWMKRKWHHLLNSLKFQHVNAIYYTYMYKTLV